VPSFTTFGHCQEKPPGYGSGASRRSIVTVPAPTLEREHAFWADGCRIVAGVDEVGRGPLAGPVVAAAVVFGPNQSLIEGLRDSKQMTARQREEIALVVRDEAIGWSVGAASVREIDRRNILRATALAMRRAVAALPQSPERLLVDGTPLPELRVEHEAIVKGDSVSLSIAAASVLAKCVRDRLMIRLAGHYPEFGWESNKGYATAEHLGAIDELGLTPHHRRSFAPLGQFDLF